MKPSSRLSELIEALQQGDLSVSNEFALLVLPDITRQIRTFYPDEDDCLSAAGCIIAKIQQKIGTFDLKKNPMPYISRIARNHCIDEFRKDKARRTRERNYAQANDDAISGELEVSAKLEDIYGEYKEIIRLKFLEGMNNPEIAEKLGLPRKTVSYQVQQAYLKAKDYLYGK